jgi:CheY-like chemotaxis protein
MNTAESEKVLVAAASAADAEVIRKSLEGEFPSIACACEPDHGTADFDRHQPSIVILAFHNVETSEQYYLALFRNSQSIAQLPHRTILLCNKDEVRAAYALCRSGCFDDYVQYWPVTFDQPRLAMSVRVAGRELAASRRGGHGARLGHVARAVDEVQPILDRAMAHSDRYLIAADHALRSLADGIGSAMQDTAAGLGERLMAMSSGSGMARDVKRYLGMLADETLLPQVREAASAIAPARESLAEAAAAVRPRLASVRKLTGELAEPPTILIVEDEETQRQIYRHVLDRSRYRLAFAASGTEALRLASRAAPALILMDIMLPDLTGVEVTRRLKNSDTLAGVPVVMITGHSERDVVMESLAAGAADFLVKPFTPQMLQQKVAQYVEQQAMAPA